MEPHHGRDGFNDVGAGDGEELGLGLQGRVAMGNRSLKANCPINQISCQRQDRLSQATGASCDARRGPPSQFSPWRLASRRS